jgi:GNAT superfamily N-acetyltransferase
MQEGPTLVAPKVFLRQGPIDRERGSYFTEPGFSTYSDTAVHTLDRYRADGIKLAVAETEQAGEVLQLALALSPEGESRTRIQEAIDLGNFIDYHLNDEVPEVVQAAKALGYHGITVFENDDLPGSPTSSFIWETSRLEKQPAIDWTPGGGCKFTKIGHSTIAYGVASDGRSGEIASLRTPPAKRNQGSARRAMEYFMAQADEQGLSVKIIASPLDKRTKLHRLVKFYQGFGFQPTGETVNAYADPVLRREPPSAQRAISESGRHAVPNLARLPTPVSASLPERGTGMAR